MVKVCNKKYPQENEIKYKNFIEKYSFVLSDFQKWSIESIVEGNHSLITAHTGSGKTLPAEFAIDYFVSKNKKVIYCSPIKALSNEKFYDFSKKYPNISFGIITGDIKFNVEADVLIMTTEILLNKLYENNFKYTQVLSDFDEKNVSNVSNVTNEKISSLSINNFDIDINHDLACIIYDEVHYINDSERGKVWEESIIMTPKHVQMIMLSATIDNPEKFAVWIENRYDNDNKIVYLSGTNIRVVPLTHYFFITCNNRLFKILKDKVLEQEIKKVTNKPITIKNSNEQFIENNFHLIKKTLQIFENKNIRIKRSFAVNQLLDYLVKNDMLPAICFIFSRKNVEVCASEITTNLLDFDSKIPYVIKRECEQIIRKLPNYREYLELPEYIKIVSLLEKGIGIHHAGITPVLREMIEICFSKGYVKLLLATETFAVGINMPTKTVIFTDVLKYDGSGLRMLYSHEYTQMAGRAGRRGIDNVGNIFQLTNLFKNLETQDYRLMMTGNPQSLVSKFKISYNLILNLIFTKNFDFLGFIKKGMINNDISIFIKNIDNKIKETEHEIEKIMKVIFHLKTPLELLQIYLKLKTDKQLYVNKKKKEIEKKIIQIENENKITECDLNVVSNYNNKIKELEKYKEDYFKTDNYLSSNVDKILDILKCEKYIVKHEETNEIYSYKLTKKGYIASQLREVPSLIISPFIENEDFNCFSPTEMVGILGCFTNINVNEEIKNIIPYSKNEKVENFLRIIHKKINELIEIETIKNINTGVNYYVQYDTIDIFMRWCDMKNDGECRSFLQDIEKEKNIFLGDFVKGTLKLNNVALELEKIYEYFGNIEGLNAVKRIPELILKYVVTNQSLYI